MSDKSIQKIILGHKNYPKSLMDLKDPPKAIYYKGKLENIDLANCLAVVGTRNITAYGRQVLETLIPELVANNVCIVSGFMYGVDTYAHKLALECGGKTLAVMGNGLNVVYPVENAKLYTDIISQEGVMLSEYEPNTKPHLWTYPKRNRIVAALSLLGTLIVEADIDSGSLVTAKYAKSLKRKVFAIPGQITSKYSNGTNVLIKNGDAKMVLNTEDIINIEHRSDRIDFKPYLDGIDAKIYQSILKENLTLDELSFELNENISAVSIAVNLLIVKGLLEEIGGKFYLKKTR